MGAGTAACLLLCLAVATAAVAATDEVRVRGELKGVTLDNRDDHWSGGTMTVDTRRIIVPPRLLIELPGATLTLQELFALAPGRCRRDGVTGLLKTDGCRAQPGNRQPARRWLPQTDTTPRTTLDPEPTDAPPSTTAQVTVVTGEGPDPVATRVLLTRAERSVSGAVTFISEEQGYLRIGGAFGVDQGGPLVRLNDPEARQSVQRGVGCGGEGNCSPDARFRAGAAQATVRFDDGYAACVPGGLGDVCAAASRPVRGVVDASLLVPIRLGDHVAAQGAFEVLDGTRVFFAHTLVVHTPALAPDRE